jgi:membrane-associated phospholipid phosphatase
MFFSALSFWQKIEHLDQRLFIQLNSRWTNTFFDAVMPYIRNPVLWVPLYIFLALFVLLNFKIKGLWWAVLFFSTIALTDLAGTYIFKYNVQRLRPCNDPDFFFNVRLLLNQCGGYSFISNHAANHFGMATFFYITFRHLLKKWTWIPFLWAAFIGYAQIYVGIHYPLDVFCGTILGLLTGILTGVFFNKRFGFAIFDNQPIV